jgi:hypothetical protein
MSINELKLKKEQLYLLINENEIKYRINFKLRNKNDGGGVAILIKSCLQSTNIIFDKRFDDVEIIGEKVYLSGGVIKFYSFYNAAPCFEFERLSCLLENNSILAGDLNAIINNNNLNRNGKELNKFILESANAYIIENKEPTYHRIVNSKLIESRLDYFIATADLNIKENKCAVLHRTCLDSDHWPIMVEILSNNRPVINNATEHRIERFIYAKADWEYYREEINFRTLAVDRRVMAEADVNELNDIICEIIMSAANKSIPKSQPGNNKTSKTTLPLRIRKKIEDKNQLKRRIFIEKKAELKSEYNKKCKEIKKEIQDYRDKPWEIIVENNKNKILSTPHVWKKINQMQGKTSSKIAPLVVNGELIIDDKRKAAIFANNLAETFSNTENPRFNNAVKLAVEEKLQEKILNEDAYRLLGLKRSECKEFTMGELIFTLERLNLKSAVGPDKIHNLMLANLPPRGLNLLLNLINRSLSTGILAENWKKSKVTMIPKKTTTSDPNNYRPISLTSCLGKLVEKLIAHRLNCFIKEKKILVKEQSGFQTNRSTTDNLIFMVQKACEAINEKEACLAIFFDIAKAFDKVWHEGLIHKLFQYSIPVYLINWLHNFLTNRKFSVKVNDYESDEHPISAGVPQGAVLSPILFCLYINDAPLLFDKWKCYSLLFADDLVFLFSFKRFSDIKNRVKKELNKLEKWLSNWRLKIAVEKCQFTVFTQNKINIEEIELEMYQERIVYERNPKFLGVSFDPRMIFNYHIEQVKIKCIKRLSIIKILSHRSWKLSKRVLILLYYSLIRSIIEYNSFIVHTITATQRTVLQTIQNKALKVILKPPFRTNLQRLGLQYRVLPIESRMMMLSTKYIYKAISVSNPLIKILIEEYLELYENLEEIKQSPLWWEKEDLKEIIDTIEEKKEK